MGPQPLFLGEVVLLAEDLLDVAAEELALALPEDFLEMATHVPVAGLGPDRVEDTAVLWERIVRGRWFGDDSIEIAAACMRMLLDPETELSWPDAVLKEIRRVGEALEDSALDRADLTDWIGSWLAQAKLRSPADRRPSPTSSRDIGLLDDRFLRSGTLTRSSSARRPS
jgi:hypothetical protein